MCRNDSWRSSVVSRRSRLERASALVALLLLDGAVLALVVLEDDFVLVEFSGMWSWDAAISAASSWGAAVIMLMMCGNDRMEDSLKFVGWVFGVRAANFNIVHRVMS